MPSAASGELRKIHARVQRSEQAAPEARVHFDDVDSSSRGMLAQIDVRNAVPPEHRHQPRDDAQHFVVRDELDAARRLKTIRRVAQRSLNRVREYLAFLAQHAAVDVAARDFFLHDRGRGRARMALDVPQQRVGGVEPRDADAVAAAPRLDQNRKAHRFGRRRRVVRAGEMRAWMRQPMRRQQARQLPFVVCRVELDERRNRRRSKRQSGRAVREPADRALVDRHAYVGADRPRDGAGAIDQRLTSCGTPCVKRRRVPRRAHRHVGSLRQNVHAHPRGGKAPDDGGRKTAFSIDNQDAGLFGQSAPRGNGTAGFATLCNADDERVGDESTSDPVIA